MPKPIKKRVYKKPTAQDEVRNIYEILREYYVNNRRFINIFAIGLITIIIVLFGGTYYIKANMRKALYFQYEGLKAFHEQLSETKTKDELKIAYEKFQNSYKRKKSPFTLLYKAYTEDKLGKKDEALDTLTEVIKNYKTPDIQSLAYYKMYEIYLSEKKPKRAMEVLDKILTLNGQYLKDLALYNKAKLLEAQNKKQDALKIYKQLAKLYPNSPFTNKIKTKIKPLEKKKSSKSTGKEANKQ